MTVPRRYQTSGIIDSTILFAALHVLNRLRSTSGLMHGLEQLESPSASAGPPAAAAGSAEETRPSGPELVDALAEQVLPGKRPCLPWSQVRERLQRPVAAVR